MSLLSPPLEAFMAIVRQHTVQGAGVELHITQTAVTQRIRNLERSLQTTLFVRTRRGMLLTPEGEALYQYCLGALELEGKALAKISGAGLLTPVQVTITGPSSFMQSRVIPKCYKVISAFPNVLLHFDVHDAGDPMKALRVGECQFAIIAEEAVSKDVQCKVLTPERYVLVCSAQWQDRDMCEIIQNERIIDFNPQDEMTFNYLKHFSLYYHASHERHFANRTDSIAAMIAAGLGYGVLTEAFYQSYIGANQLRILNDRAVYEYQQVMVWYARPEPPPYFQAIIDAVS